MPWLASLVILLLVGQLLFMHDPDVPWGRKILDLDAGGDSWMLFVILGLVGAAIGVLIGSALGDMQDGAWLGLLAGFLAWLVLLLASPKHMDDHDGE